MFSCFWKKKKVSPDIKANVWEKKKIIKSVVIEN